MTVYNKTQAAKVLGISVETLNRYKRQGKIPHRKIGDRVLFTESDLNTFLDSCAVPATTQPTNREAQEIAKAATQESA